MKPIDLAGTPYQPSNGTEGMTFEATFCDQCERDRAFYASGGYDDGCEIHARALGFDVSDKEYPVEWTHDENGDPTCTAFQPFIEIKEPGWDTSDNLEIEFE